MIIGANVFQTMARLGSIEGVDRSFMSRKDFLVAVNKILDMGYEQVELLTDPMLMAFEQEDLDQLIPELGALSKSRGAQWSVHLPFWWVNGSTLDENVRQASTKTYLDIIRTTRPLDPTHYVLHSITNLSRLRKANASQEVKDLTMQLMIDAAKRTAQALVDALGDPSKLCIENMTNVDFCWDLGVVQELGTSICLDIGHYFHRGGSVIGFLEEHFSTIKCIHAHNIVPTINEGDAMNWRAVDHFALGEGLMDNERLLRWLVEREYAGSLIVEVRSLVEGQKSIDFLRELEIIK